MERLLPERSGEQRTKRDNLRLIPTLLLLMRLSINKVAHVAAAAVQGLREGCLSSIYRSTLEKKITHFLTDAIRLPSKARGFWPLQSKSEDEQWQNYSHSKYISNWPFQVWLEKQTLWDFFSSQKKRFKHVKKMGLFMKFIWIKAKRLSLKKKTKGVQIITKNKSIILHFVHTGKKSPRSSLLSTLLSTQEKQQKEA